MSLKSLQAHGIRNLCQVHLDLNQKLNLFLGSNGSGKTSLLEAVYFLSSGRSFRQQLVEPLIQHSLEACTVFGVVSLPGGRASRLGVRRTSSGERELRVDGSNTERMSELAQLLPCLVLGPETVELLTGSPGGRRRFINHGVFHVEPEFGELWFQANRCLKQRNQILKIQGQAEQRQVWTDRLVQLANRIDMARQAYFADWEPVFNEICHSLSGLKGVKCSYIRGWDARKDLADIYAAQLEQDLHRGFTQSGYQRADVKLTIRGQTAASICSRGELKILAWAMVISQGMVISGGNRTAPVYLVDDLGSELDRSHREKVCTLLYSNEGQILATGTDPELLEAPWGNVPFNRFHVEHGSVSLNGTKEQQTNER